MALRTWSQWSIEWKLPLLQGVVLVSVIAALSVTAYVQVERSAKATARDRLNNVVQQYATAIDTSARQVKTTADTTGRRPAIRSYLRSPSPANRAGALAALRYTGSQPGMVAAVTLWDARGRRLLSIGPDTARVDSAFIRRRLAAADAGGAGAWVDSFRVVHDTVAYPVVAPINDRDTRLGYLVQWRYVVTTPQSQEVTLRLIGSDAALYVGNGPAGTWSDLLRAAPPPPVSPRPGELMQYDRPGRGEQFAVAAQLTLAPWIVLIEFPRGTVLAPARQFLRRLIGLAAFFLAAGLLAAWAASRWITRPIRVLTTASTAMEGGGQEVPRVPVDRKDELGRLAEAFNRAAEAVHRVQRGLEDTVAERTRELQNALGMIQESEHRLSQILESLPVAVYVVDDAGRPRFANRVSREILGRGIAPDARAEDLAQVYHAYRTTTGDPYPGDEQPIVYALRGEEAHAADLEIRRPDRAVRIEVWAAPVFDREGRLASAVAAFTDITERERERGEIERLNLELRASEQLFRNVALTANDGIVMMDAAGRITHVNPGAERIFGYRAAELVGQPVTVLMPERFHGAHRQGLARFLESGEAKVIGRTVELAGRREDGSEFPLELSLATWTRDQKPAFCGIIRDITRRKENEAALQRYAAELESANAELESFSYSVSHDLRAPLRAIDGFARILEEDHGSRLDREARRLLGVIRGSASSMGQLIDDLLTFSRLSRKSLEPGEINMTALARAAAEDCRAAAGASTARITVATLPPVRGDGALLRQAWINLLSNAVKFTRKEPEPAIEVGVANGQEGTVFFVRDNGVGFDMRYADKLFGVFQRLHRAEEFEGTGVGLAIVHRVIHRHGGRVWAESAPGKGATFYFVLPGGET
jgi:PAS domain S-box-containing protein